MIDYPKTLAEASLYRYRVWAGSPKGEQFNSAKCAYEVPEGGRSPLFRQCSRKPGHGLENLYCKTHAKIAK